MTTTPVYDPVDALRDALAAARREYADATAALASRGYGCTGYCARAAAEDALAQAGNALRPLDAYDAAGRTYLVPLRQAQSASTRNAVEAVRAFARCAVNAGDDYLADKERAAAEEAAARARAQATLAAALRAGLRR